MVFTSEFKNVRFWLEDGKDSYKTYIIIMYVILA